MAGILSFPAEQPIQKKTKPNVTLLSKTQDTAIPILVECETMNFFLDFCAKHASAIRGVIKKGSTPSQSLQQLEILSAFQMILERHRPFLVQHDEFGEFRAGGNSTDSQKSSMKKRRYSSKLFSSRFASVGKLIGSKSLSDSATHKSSYSGENLEQSSSSQDLSPFLWGTVELEDVIDDLKLKSAMHSYLKESFMAEPLELWFDLEEVCLISFSFLFFSFFI